MTETADVLRWLREAPRCIMEDRLGRRHVYMQDLDFPGVRLVIRGAVLDELLFAKKVRLVGEVPSRPLFYRYDVIGKPAWRRNQSRGNGPLRDADD